MKTLTLPQLKKKVWDQFSRYIRLRDAQKWLQKNPEYNGEPAAPCITCGRIYPIFGKGCLQAGHFIPGRNNFLLFDEEQVHAQCDSCNRHKKGNWPAYYDVMVNRHGLNKIQNMIASRNTIMSYTKPQLEMMLDHYKEQCQQIEAEI